jgi:hypothetical protein
MQCLRYIPTKERSHEHYYYYYYFIIIIIIIIIKANIVSYGRVLFPPSKYLQLTKAFFLLSIWLLTVIILWFQQAGQVDVNFLLFFLPV